MKKSDLSVVMSEIDEMSESTGRLCYVPPDRVNFDELLYRSPEDVCNIKFLAECIKKFLPWKKQISWADAILRVLYAHYGDKEALQEFLAIFGPWNYPDATFTNGGIVIREYDYVLYPDGDTGILTSATPCSIPWASKKMFPSYTKEICEGTSIPLYS